MDIFEEIARSLGDREQIMLATIISATGSTPAPELSKMIIQSHGLSSLGTVGGGCLEAEILSCARSIWDRNEARIKTFHLEEENAESGLICGGTLEVLIEPLAQTFLPVLRELRANRSNGEDGALVTVLKDNTPVLKFYVPGASDTASLPRPFSLQSRIRESAADVIRTYRVARFWAEGQEVIIEPIGGQPSLIIFGGGHISKFVSHFASRVGFRVTVIDDRVAFANKARFPEASEVVCQDLLDATDQLSITPSTYITIITRGHKFDEVVLEKIIHSDAKYIGVIGSKKKVLTAYRHYLEKGIARELIERIRAPVGLDIGALTAEEIAISIVAELIHVRRGGPDSVLTKSAEIPKLLAAIEQDIAR